MEDRLATFSALVIALLAAITYLVIGPVRASGLLVFSLAVLVAYRLTLGRFLRPATTYTDDADDPQD